MSKITRINVGRSKIHHFYCPTGRNYNGVEGILNSLHDDLIKKGEGRKEDKGKEENHQAMVIFGLEEEEDENQKEVEVQQKENEAKGRKEEVKNLITLNDLDQIGMTEEEYMNLKDDVRTTINNIILRKRSKVKEVESLSLTSHIKYQKKDEPVKYSHAPSNTEIKKKGTNEGRIMNRNNLLISNSAIVMTRNHRGKTATMSDLF